MPIITLTTDFGTGSPYVAAMKGVILSINPAATIVDISHAVPAQDIARGALVLEDTDAAGSPTTRSTWPWSIRAWARERSILYARIGRQQYIAPDNGLLSRLMARTPPSMVLRLTERRVLAGGGFAHLPRPRHHGPGRRPLEPGPRSRGGSARPLEQLDQLDLPLPQVVEREDPRRGHLDRFLRQPDHEHLRTTCSAGRPTDSRVCIVCGIYETCGIYHTYGEQAAGDARGLDRLLRPPGVGDRRRQRRRPAGRFRRHAGGHGLGMISRNTNPSKLHENSPHQSREVQG